MSDSEQEHDTEQNPDPDPNPNRDLTQAQITVNAEKAKEVEALFLLREADRILAQEEKWTQGAAARDKHGIGTYVGNPSVCCWCLTGALQQADRNLHSTKRLLFHGGWVYAIETLRAVTGADSIGYFNDHQTFQGVKSALAKAIKEIESKEKKE